MTTAPVTIQITSGGNAHRPEWVRLVPTGQPCPWSSLSRSTLWNLIQTGAIRSVVLRRPGNLRGARLIHLQSLLDYLESLPTGTEESEIGKAVDCE